MGSDKKVKTKLKIFRSSRYTVLSTVILLVLVITFTTCFNIISVNQPATAMAGETINIIVNVEILDDPHTDGIGVDGSIFVFGLLAPKSWNAAENTSVSISSSPFSTTLSTMPEGELEPKDGFAWTETIESLNSGGFGENYGEVEWIMFKADTAYNPQPVDLPLTGTVNIETTVGPKNMITQLGYFIGDAEWGTWEMRDNFSFFYTDCIEITDGEGEIMNLCGPPPASGTVDIFPSTFSYNDLINITFDANKGSGDDPTALQGANSVYLCAIAHYDAGSMGRCNTALDFKGDDIWKGTIWPSEHFVVPEGKEITSVTFYFQNENGTIIVNDPIIDKDFDLVAECNYDTATK